MYNECRGGQKCAESKDNPIQIINRDSVLHYTQMKVRQLNKHRDTLCTIPSEGQRCFGCVIYYYSG